MPARRILRFLGLVTLFVSVLVDGAGMPRAAAAHALSRSHPGLPNCPPGAVLARSYASGVRQLVSVVARPGSTTASVATWQRNANCFVRVGGPFAAEIGRAGLSSVKFEGDGTTPVGTFPIGVTMYGTRPDPGVAFPYHRIVCGDWWDEDPRSSGYNRFVHLPCGAVPLFGGDSEALWRIQPAYDYFAAIGYNAGPTIPGRGSAIFLHVSTGGPTAGCVALPVSALLAVLRWLQPSQHPAVAISLVSS